jgi:abortive infection bacteriophage resistance protein
MRGHLFEGDLMDVKNPMTYEKQISILKAHGCAVHDDSAAIEMLKRVGYYRLSGYLIAYKKNDGMYKDGVSFERVAAIYAFDQDLRGIISKAVSEIEITAKSVISYHHGHRYGSLGYLDASNFNERHDHQKFAEQFEAAVRNNKNALFVRHHIKTYNGKFPIWVAAELFTMGMISLFFADLKTDDKKVVAKDFCTDYAHLESWLHSASVLRNICAHHGRLYNILFHQNPKLPREYKKYANMGVCSLFKQLYMLKLLYSNRRSYWNSSFVALMSALVEKYGHRLDMNAMGFPVNWEQALTWQDDMKHELAKAKEKAKDLNTKWVSEAEFWADNEKNSNE